MKLHPMVKELLIEIELYLQRTGLAYSKFGRDAVGDGYFIRRLYQGRIPHIRTIDRVHRFMRRKQP